MWIIKKLKHNFIARSKDYTPFKPKKDIWYNYISYIDCDMNALTTRNLPYINKYSHPLECWEIRPYAYINGRKHRARFKLEGNKCIVNINNRREEHLLKNCSFAYKFKFFHHKKTSTKKRSKKAGGEYHITPSGYGEYYVTLYVYS